MIRISAVTGTEELYDYFKGNSSLGTPWVTTDKNGVISSNSVMKAAQGKTEFEVIISPTKKPEYNVTLKSTKDPSDKLELKNSDDPLKAVNSWLGKDNYKKASSSLGLNPIIIKIAARLSVASPRRLHRISAMSGDDLTFSYIANLHADFVEEGFLSKVKDYEVDSYYRPYIELSIGEKDNPIYTGKIELVSIPYHLVFHYKEDDKVMNEVTLDIITDDPITKLTKHLKQNFTF